MRFISKNSNLRVILKPGLSAEPLSGRPSDPGISVKFLDGLLEVSDQVIIDKLMVHSGLTMDFWAVADNELKDPFKHMREEVEPVHHITEFKYGRPDQTLVSARKAKLTPELEKILNERAFEIAKELLPGMVEQLMKAGIAKQAASSTVNEVEANPRVAPLLDDSVSDVGTEDDELDSVGLVGLKGEKSEAVTLKKKHWKVIQKEEKESQILLKELRKNNAST